MPIDLIQKGLTLLNQKLKDHASQTYQYVRGDVTIPIAMVLETPQHSQFSLLGGSPSGLDMAQANPVNVDRDFSFEAADLVINGLIVTPAEGDQVQLTADDGTTYIYELMAPQSGQTMWKYMTGYQHDQARILIHTKFLEAV